MIPDTIAIVKVAKVAKVPKSEHIFPATILEPMALDWQRLTKSGQEGPALQILERIIELSRSMLERLAQHEKYDLTVDLPTLVASAQVKVASWLEKWDQSKGSLFTWMSKCAKYCFLAEVVRMSTHRKRFHGTDDDLTGFAGNEQPQSVTDDEIEEIQRRLKKICSRWSNPQINDCIRFHIAAIVENPSGSRKAVVRSGAYASGLSVEMSRFMYGWSMYIVRDAMLDKMDLPYTEQDLLCLSEQFSFIPDLLNIITWKQMTQMIALMGGARLKIPTLVQLQTLKKKEALYRAMTRTQFAKSEIAEVAREHGVTERHAADVFADMAAMLRGSRDAEVPLYE